MFCKRLNGKCQFSIAQRIAHTYAPRHFEKGKIKDGSFPAEEQDLTIWTMTGTSIRQPIN
jgi:hypothetical protein